MPTYIRVKQIDPDELSAYFNESIVSNSGVLYGYIASEAISLTGDQTISGFKTFNSGTTFEKYIELNNLGDHANLSGLLVQVSGSGLRFFNKTGQKFFVDQIAGSGTGLNTLQLSNTNTTLKIPNNKNGYLAIDSELVHNTGQEIISGQKTFKNPLYLSDLNINDIDNIYISGVDMELHDLNISLNGTSLGTSLSIPVVYTTGDQTISGIKTFINDFIVSGTGSTFPILQITGVNDVSINGNNSFGNYIIREFKTNSQLFKSNYLRHIGFQNIQISGLKTNNVINVFADDPLINYPNSLIKSYQYIMVDGPTTNSHNATNITSGIYSGKALRRLKTGPTIANGYKVIPSLQSGGALVTPKQKYLETVYNITVESGQGAIRPLNFTAPNITTANNPIITLKFNFQADTGVCIVSGRYQNGSAPIFTITGANYNFIQTERLMYHHQQNQNGGTYIRI